MKISYPGKQIGAPRKYDCLVYDMLIYWDEVNRKFIPGLAESWEVSPDALTLTYHLRKGVQFSGWVGRIDLGGCKV